MYVGHLDTTNDLAGVDVRGMVSVRVTVGTDNNAGLEVVVVAHEVLHDNLGTLGNVEGKEGVDIDELEVRVRKVRTEVLRAGEGTKSRERAARPGMARETSLA